LIVAAAELETHWLALKARQLRKRNHIAEGKSADHPSAKPV